MFPEQIFNLKTLVLNMVACDKRNLAHQVLDHVFENAKTLTEYDIIGECSLKTEHRDLYLKCAEAAYSVALTTEERFAARSNLIKAYNTMNHPEKALDLIEQQLMVIPDHFGTLCDKAANISLTGNKDEAEKIIMSLREKYPEKQYDLEAGLSGKYLREGNFVKGVLSFIAINKPKHKLYDEQLKMKRWDGVARPGKTLYVEGEGGIGDEIINIRFFEKVQRMGMRPILCSPNTKYYQDKNALFRRHGIEILSESYSIDVSQPWLPMMSLPATMNFTENDLWEKPYLFPQRNAKNKLPSKKFKIGIKCSGNPYFAQDEYRKIPLNLMLSYLPEDSEIYYIDKEKINNSKVIDLSDRIHSWEDTLDFIDQMDCIVSSCTSLVHAAGAIGKTTFVAVPIAEYYIWTTSRRDHTSPWYGENFHVFRQKKPRDWCEPLSEISKHVFELRDKHNV